MTLLRTYDGDTVGVSCQWSHEPDVCHWICACPSFTRGPSELLSRRNAEKIPNRAAALCIVSFYSELSVNHILESMDISNFLSLSSLSCQWPCYTNVAEAVSRQGSDRLRSLFNAAACATCQLRAWHTMRGPQCERFNYPFQHAEPALTMITTRTASTIRVVRASQVELFQILGECQDSIVES